MASLNEHEARGMDGVGPTEETGGVAVLRWGALVALVVLLCLSATALSAVVLQFFHH